MVEEYIAQVRFEELDRDIDREARRATTLRFLQQTPATVRGAGAPPTAPSAPRLIDRLVAWLPVPARRRPAA